MSVAGIQSSNLPSSLGVSQQNQSQQPRSTPQISSVTSPDTSAYSLTAGPESGSPSEEPAQSLRLSDFQTFVHDLEAGNLAGAQQALLELRQELQSAGLDLSLASGVTPSGSLGQLERDFQALETALSSGNLPEAQLVVGQFSQDAQSLVTSQQSPTNSAGGSTFSTTA